MIVHNLDKQGGFTVGDTESGLTAYAYPTSSHATIARRMPDRIAAEMIKSAKACTVPKSIRDDYDARHWLTLAAKVPS